MHGEKQYPQALVLSVVSGSPAEMGVPVLAPVSQALCWAQVLGSYPPVSLFIPPFI